MSNESKFENEYKNYKVDFIQLLDELDEGRWAHEPDMRAELDEVYAEAAKADEYEAKAKAFDAVVDIAYWYFERVNPEYADFSDYEGFYDDIKDEFKKHESGESE